MNATAETNEITFADCAPDELPDWTKSLSDGLRSRLRKLPRQAIEKLCVLGVAHWNTVAQSVANSLHNAGFNKEEMREVLTISGEAYQGEVTARDIEKVIAKSRDEAPAGGRTEKAWPDFDRRVADKIIEESETPTLSKFLDLHGEPETCEPWEILESLFPGDPLLCIAEKKKEKFLTQKLSEWTAKGTQRNFIVPSPMSARKGKKTDGNLSARTLDNTGPRRFLVIEFDKLPHDEQAPLIAHLAEIAPLVIVLDTGNKSLHAWMRCDDESEGDRRRFMEYAVTLGADKSTWTMNQLVRLPGGTHDKEGNPHKVLIFRPTLAEAEGWNLDRLPDIQESGKSSEVTKGDFLAKLEGMIASTPDNIAAMEELAREAVFILPKIAMSGQLTIINASYNAGKTLLCCWLLSQRDKGVGNSQSVYYINADDTYAGSIEKGKFMAGHGINFLIPGERGFSVDLFETILKDAVQSKSAGEIVFILDTLKKFVDMMDKKSARHLCILLREFVQAGGTVIALAHTNKNKASDGSSIAEGVGDFLNDFDCGFTIEIAGEMDAPRRTVLFKNTKSRGPNAKKVTFTYDNGEDRSWLERFHSIVELDRNDGANAVALIEAEQVHKEDKPVIDYICVRLAEGELSCREIGQKDLKNGFSRGRREEVLDRYSHENENPDHCHWDFTKGKTGGRVYSLNEADFLL